MPARGPARQMATLVHRSPYARWMNGNLRCPPSRQIATVPRTSPAARKANLLSRRRHNLRTVYATGSQFATKLNTRRLHQQLAQTESAFCAPLATCATVRRRPNVLLARTRTRAAQNADYVRLDIVLPPAVPCVTSAMLALLLQAVLQLAPSVRVAASLLLALQRAPCGVRVALAVVWWSKVRVQQTANAPHV